MEREKLRETEPEPAPRELYEAGIEMWAAAIHRARQGKLVIKGKEIGWEQNRQGFIKWYLHPLLGDTAVDNWLVFVHDIRTHSGRHTHQGGTFLYVLEGRGYTLVDGRRVDWEAGDAILLPIKPGGVEHQHFNREAGKPCKWLALIFRPLKDVLGNTIRQEEASPEWKGRQRREHLG